MATTVGNLRVTLGLALEGFEANLARAKKDLAGLGTSLGQIGKMAAGFALAEVGISGLAGAFSAVKNTVIGMNASLEKAELQFEVLLGSADDAKRHVRDLFKFAADTPFETKPIIAASKTLLTFGFSAEEVTDKLRLVGDAAAVTGADINEVAMWTGRAYAAIQAGRPFGEAAQRLTELTVLTPQARARMEELQKSGASSADVFRVLEQELGRFGGGMIKMANSWDGLVSSISDGASLAIATAFQPFFESAKSGLASVAQALKELDVSALTQKLKPAFDIVMSTVTSFGKLFGDLFTALTPALSSLGSTFGALFLVINTGIQTVLIPFRGLMAAIAALVEGDWLGAWGKAKDAMVDQASTAASSASKLLELATGISEAASKTDGFADAQTRAKGPTGAMTKEVEGQTAAWTSFLSISERLRDHYGQAMPFAFGKTITVVDKLGDAGTRMGEDLDTSFNEGAESAADLTARVQRLHGAFGRVEEIRAASNETRKLHEEQRAAAEGALESQREAARGWSMWARDASAASSTFSARFGEAWGAFKTGLAGAETSWEGFTSSVQQLGTSVAQNLTAGFSDFLFNFVTGTATAAETFAQFGKALLRTIIDFLAQAAVKKFLSFLTSIGSGNSSFVPDFLHAGGIAGLFSAGGGIGLGPNDVPAILERGEAVLSGETWAKLKDLVGLGEGPSAFSRLSDFVSGGVGGVVDKALNFAATNPGLTAASAAALVGLALSMSGDPTAAAIGQAVAGLAPLVGVGTTLGIGAFTGATGSLLFASSAAGAAALGTGTASAGAAAAAGTLGAGAAASGAAALVMVPMILGMLTRLGSDPYDREGLWQLQLDALSRQMLGASISAGRTPDPAAIAANIGNVGALASILKTTPGELYRLAQEAHIAMSGIHARESVIDIGGPIGGPISQLNTLSGLAAVLNPDNVPRYNPLYATNQFTGQTLLQEIAMVTEAQAIWEKNKREHEAMGIPFDVPMPYAGSFDLGGIVPGALGAPQLAVVHGGEEVLTPEQRKLRRRGGSTSLVAHYPPSMRGGVLTIRDLELVIQKARKSGSKVISSDVIYEVHRG